MVIRIKGEKMTAHMKTRTENKISSNRVLIIHPALAPYRLDLFNELSGKLSIEIVFLESNVDGNHFDQTRLQAALKVTPLYAKSRKILGKSVPVNITRYISEFRPQVVVTSEFSITTAIVALYKIILNQNEKFSHVIWTDDNPKSISSDSLLRIMVRKLLSGLVDGWIFISNEAKDLYSYKYKCNQASAVVPIIHSDKAFRQLLEGSIEYSQKLIHLYNLDEKKVLLYTGRLVSIKGLDHLLESFAIVARSRPNAILVIVGDGPEKSNLHSLSQRLGIAKNVIFVGRLEGVSLYAWYLVANVFTLPSLVERFGAVVNEALISGLPCIVSENAGARILIDEGINGSIIDPTKHDRYSTAIVNWLDKESRSSFCPNVKPSRMHVSFEDAVESVVALTQSFAGPSD